MNPCPGCIHRFLYCNLSDLRSLILVRIIQKNALVSSAVQASPPFPHSFRAKSSCSDYVLAMANLNLYLFLKKCDFSVVICPLTINTNEDLHESKEIIYSYFYPNNLKTYPINSAERKPSFSATAGRPAK